MFGTNLKTRVEGEKKDLFVAAFRKGKIGYDQRVRGSNPPEELGKI